MGVGGKKKKLIRGRNAFQVAATVGGKLSRICHEAEEEGIQKRRVTEQMIKPDEEEHITCGDMGSALF